MTRQHHIAYLAVGAVALFTLAACGQGAAPPGDQSQPLAKTLSGTVADGYLVGATVCLDTNRNKRCDSGEPAATTGSGGRYQLRVEDASLLTRHPLTVEVGTTVVDEDTGSPVDKAYVLTAPAGQGQFISPLSTMLQIQQEQNPGLSLTEIESDLLHKLGMRETGLSLFDDYIAGKAQDARAADYQALHDVAQITVRSLAQNLANMQQALADPSAFAAMLALAIQETVAALPLVRGAIDAARDDGQLDADEINTIADSLILSTDDLAQRLALGEATGPASQPLSKQLAEGYYGLWAGFWLGLEEITAVHFFEQNNELKIQNYAFNFQSNQFDQEASGSPYLYLTPSGWAEITPDCGIKLSYQGNNQATISDSCQPAVNSILQRAATVALEGMIIQDYLRLETNDVGDLALFMANDSARFSSAAKAHRLIERSDGYWIFSYGSDPIESLQQGTAMLNLPQMLSASAWDDGNTDALLFFIGSIPLPEGCAPADCRGALTLAVEFIADSDGAKEGAANFYIDDGSRNNWQKQAQGRWQIKTINGVELLIYEVPPAFAVQYRDTLYFDAYRGIQEFFTVYNNQVERGEFQPPGFSIEYLVFNKAAFEEISALITLPQ